MSANLTLRDFLSSIPRIVSDTERRPRFASVVVNRRGLTAHQPASRAALVPATSVLACRPAQCEPQRVRQFLQVKRFPNNLDGRSRSNQSFQGRLVGSSEHVAPPLAGL